MMRWLVSIVLVVAVVGYFVSHNRTQERQAATIKTPARIEKAEIFERIDREISALNSFDAKEFTESTELITMGALVFSAHAKLLQSARDFQLTEPEEEKLRRCHPRLGTGPA